MSSMKDMINAGTCKYNDKLKKLCMPLFNYLNLSNFGYFRVLNSGQYFYLGSHLGWAEYFAHEKLYLNDPYLRHPKHFQNSISLPSEISDMSFQKILNSATDKFNIHHSLILLSKSSEGIEAFAFCSNCDRSHVSALLNELPILKLFAKHFRKENQSLFSKMEDHKVDLYSHLGSLFLEKTIHENSKTSERKSLLQQLGIINEDPLSPRETEILQYIPLGLSASQIAKKVCLAKRTVEHYIEKIKIKLSCDSKTELIQKSRELEALNFF